MTSSGTRHLEGDRLWLFIIYGGQIECPERSSYQVLAIKLVESSYPLLGGDEDYREMVGRVGFEPTTT